MSVAFFLALTLSAGPDAAVPKLGPEPDPTLMQATAGLPGSGPLLATLHTGEGPIVVRLEESKAPQLVANFVALARGLRPFVDPKNGAWVKRPFYDGLAFHRIVPGFVVQTGCPRGDGRGGPGFDLAPDPEASLRHDQAGTVSMVRFDKRLSGSQFFVTLGPEPQLDGQHEVFARVIVGLELVQRMAKASSGDDRLAPTVERVTIHRKSS